MLNKLSIQSRLILLVILVNIAGTIIFSYYSYNSRKEEIINRIDKSLELVANGAYNIIPDDVLTGLEKGQLPDITQFRNLSSKMDKYISPTKINDIKCHYIPGQSDRIFVVAMNIPKNKLDDYARIPVSDIAIDSLSKKSNFIYKNGQRIALIWNSDKVLIEAGIPVSYIKEQFEKPFTTILIISFSIISVSLLILLLVIRATIKPLKRLKDFTKVLINTNFRGSEETIKKVKRMSEMRNDEIGELSGQMLYMHSMIQQYIDNLMETFSDKEKIESELTIAADIQMGILPKQFPAFPDRNDFDLHAIIQPAKDVGGDLYDYFLIDENRLFFLIGDVSDKGVPASLFMSVTKTLFNTHALYSDFNNLCEVVAKVNKQLSRDNPKLMFVTIFAGILDLRDGSIEYVDGGHEAPFILRRSGEIETPEKKAGKLPLGVMGDFEYLSNTIKLNPGDSILLYTDGVPDAVNNNEERYAEEGMKNTLSQLTQNAGPEKINQILYNDVKSFMLGSVQFDDLAILTIQYYGKV